MSTAYVLSGGASLGSVQVGMLQALAERGTSPDLLIGTSAGALNAIYLASHGVGTEAVEDLAEVWRGLRAWQLFRPDPVHAFGTLLGRGKAMFGNRGLRALIEAHLTFDRLEEAPISLTVIATDLLSGEDVSLSSGPAVDATLASCAIPGMLPPITWGERTLVDGGLANNAAISVAVRAGAEHVYVLPCGYACAATEPPSTAFGVLAQSMSLLVQQQLIRDIEKYTGAVDLVVLPPPCPLPVSPLDFSHADELIQRAYEDSMRFLDVDGGRRRRPAVHIGMHTHTGRS